MKIGIATFHSAHNYGAVLQTWSLQEYLKQQGHEVAIINLRLPIIDNLYKFTAKNKLYSKNRTVNNAMNITYKGVHYLIKGFIFPDAEKKYRKFELFINHKLNVTKRFQSLRELKKQQLEYDVLIAGSDQIWNATMMKGINPFYFLQFCDQSVRRISYAASVGTDQIPAEFKQLFQRYLRDFDRVSVREKNAKDRLSELTDKEISVVPDPTFLLDTEDFNQLKVRCKIKGKYIYVHNVHLRRIDHSLVEIADEMSKRLNVPIIYNHRNSPFKQKTTYFGSGVGEFLGIIEGAELVITNSFHCSIFAIIFKRLFLTIPCFQNSDRMKNLLTELDLQSRLVCEIKDLPDNSEIDYEAVEYKKQKLRKFGQEYLRQALFCEKAKDTRTYFEYQDAFRCFGCGACKDICPVGAIEMQEDQEGFLYPVIHQEKCVKCQKCRRVCIYSNKIRNDSNVSTFPEVYAAYHGDKEVLKASTSGGMFIPFARYILKRGGMVAGVRYNENMQVEYSLASTEAECEAFHGSKYVYAVSEGIFPQIKQLLNKGVFVLFTGNPCRIVGLKSYLEREYDNLFTVELICQSVLSPKVFRKYCEHLEHAYRSTLRKFTFRNKMKGVKDPVVVAEFESGNIAIELAADNNLMRAFYDGTIQRPSCYQCEFGMLRCGVGDITIGDYWGIEEQHPDFVNEKGVSVLKINTCKGKKMFDEMKEELILMPSTYEAAFNKNHTLPIMMNGNRTKLMYDIDHKPIDSLLQSFNKRKN